MMRSIVRLGLGGFVLFIAYSEYMRIAEWERTGGGLKLKKLTAWLYELGGVWCVVGVIGGVGALLVAWAMYDFKRIGRADRGET